MRTSFLQDLYLQRPVTMVILICAISVLPWIGMGDFTTREEAQEAAVAVAMLETGNIVLPTSSTGAFTYKPPMAHWLMALFSYPQGYVSTFTARLPSTLAFILMISFVLIFFGRRIEKFQEAFLATCILITCIAIHRAAMTAGTDMLFTLFIVIGLIQLFRWEEMQELKGLPVMIPVTLGCAILVQGFTGLLLPLFVFAVYLLTLNKYRLPIVVKALFYICVSSLFIPVIWYVAACKQGGDSFFQVVFAESFKGFSFINITDLLSLICGFMPWTLLAFFSLFGMKFKRPGKSFRDILKDCRASVHSMEKVRLFSLVAVICILFFYSVSPARHSSYLMPSYPFLALFLAQFFLYLTEYRTKVTRFFALFMAILTAVAVVAILLTMTGIIDPAAIASRYITDTSALHTFTEISALFVSPHWITLLVLFILCIGLGIVCYQLTKKINIKILYSTIGLMFCINLLIDSTVISGKWRVESGEWKVKTSNTLQIKK